MFHLGQSGNVAPLPPTGEGFLPSEPEDVRRMARDLASERHVVPAAPIIGDGRHLQPGVLQQPGALENQGAPQPQGIERFAIAGPKPGRVKRDFRRKAYNAESVPENPKPRNPETERELIALCESQSDSRKFASPETFGAG
jgi:hypothetical protein